MPHANPFRPTDVADATSQLASRAFSPRVAEQIAPTGVIPGAYTSANITVGADGRLTAAVNGSGGGGTPDDASEQIATKAFSPRVAEQIVPTGVIPGAYTSANITVGADGRITAAASGSGGSNAMSNIYASRNFI